MTGCLVPSFFHMKKNGAAIGVFNSALEMSLAFNMVSHQFAQSLCSEGFIWYSQAGLGRGLLGSNRISKLYPSCKGGSSCIGPSRSKTLRKS